jgi:hypothetical protein
MVTIFLIARAQQHVKQACVCECDCVSVLRFFHSQFTIRVRACAGMAAGSSASHCWHT